LNLGSVHGSDFSIVPLASDGVH